MEPSVSERARAYLLRHQLALVYGCVAKTSPNEFSEFGFDKCCCCAGPLRAEEVPLRIDVVWDLESPHFDAFPVCPDCRSLTRDDVLATALYRIPVGMDDIAEMGSRDRGLMERSALGCAGGQPYLRRVFLHELKPGAPLDDLSMFAIYGAVADGKVHPRPLLAPFPWRDEEVICVGEGVEEALAVERMLAEGKGICMPIPWRSLCSGGGT